VTSNEITESREETALAVIELEETQDQIRAMLQNDPHKMQVWRTRMLTLCTNNEMLAKCTPISIIKVGLQALSINLPLEGGQGYIVKYGNEAQLDYGYKGWQMLASRAGWSILADAVYACDEFSIDGSGHDAVFKFKMFLGDRPSQNDQWAKENLRGVIVSYKEKGKDEVIKRWVTRAMLEKIRGMSPAKDSKHSPYQKWHEGMMIGKAIKSVASKMPIDLTIATEFSRAMGIANDYEIGHQQASAQEAETYSDEKFDELYPQWVNAVKSGKYKAGNIMMQVASNKRLTPEQKKRMLDLAQYEALEGESTTVSQ